MKNAQKTGSYHCQYCNKSYKYSEGLSKHIKYTCKKNKDDGDVINEVKRE